MFKIFILHNKISRHHFIAAPHPEERAYWPLDCIHKGCRLTTPLLHCMVQLGHSIEALHLACFVILHTKMRSVSACWPLHCIHKGCRLTTPLLHCMVQLGHSIEALHLACFVILHTKMRSASLCWPLHCIHKGCRLTTPLLHCMVQLGHSIAVSFSMKGVVSYVVLY